MDCSLERFFHLYVQHIVCDAKCPSVFLSLSFSLFFFVPVSFHFPPNNPSYSCQFSCSAAYRRPLWEPMWIIDHFCGFACLSEPWPHLLQETSEVQEAAAQMHINSLKSSPPLFSHVISFLPFGWPSFPIPA